MAMVKSERVRESENARESDRYEATRKEKSDQWVAEKWLKNSLKHYEGVFKLINRSTLTISRQLLARSIDLQAE